MTQQDKRKATDDGEQQLPVINIDADPFNRDWAKHTWDLDIDNAEDLTAFLRALGSTIEEFKTWPIYIWNKDKPGMEWLEEL